MKIFKCQNCNAVVFFDNSKCLTCGHELGFIPESQTMTAIDLVGDVHWQGRIANRHGNLLYRKCAHYYQDAACNWLIEDGDSSELCRSCRLTRTLPNLAMPALRSQWVKLESAKRRLCYGVAALGLRLRNRAEDPQRGVAFDFLSDVPGLHVATGHDEGVITINCAEADDVFRERSKQHLGESYRTLLGHFRHEIGHYYWDLLIKPSPRLSAFRALFGDERLDYAQAQSRHYQNGAPADWQSRHITPYASMHPWEDWAESWAHYLHGVDTVEIGQQFGISIASLGPDTQLRSRVGVVAQDSFDELLDAWIPLTYAVNSLNRGMGLADWYPFTLSTPAIEKLRFVHETILVATRPTAQAPPRPQPATDAARCANTDADAQPIHS